MNLNDGDKKGDDDDGSHDDERCCHVMDREGDRRPR